MAELVNESSLGGGNEPTSGILGRSVMGPRLVGGDERFLGCIEDVIEVMGSKLPHQVGGDFAVFGAEVRGVHMACY